jgi:hypothetical protein
MGTEPTNENAGRFTFGRDLEELHEWLRLTDWDADTKYDVVYVRGLKLVQVIVSALRQVNDPVVGAFHRRTISRLSSALEFRPGDLESLALDTVTRFVGLRLPERLNTIEALRFSAAALLDTMRFLSSLDERFGKLSPAAVNRNLGAARPNKKGGSGNVGPALILARLCKLSGAFDVDQDSTEEDIKRVLSNRISRRTGLRPTTE